VTGGEPRTDARQVLGLLSRGEMAIEGRLPWSSNATFLVAVRPPARRSGSAGAASPPGRDEDAGAPMLAIYKPSTGERPLWDFPRGLWKREVAAYELDAYLGWGLVPPTVARPDGPLGGGSLQYCVDASLEEHYFTLLDKPSHHDDLRRVAAFDLVTNNADRKGGHYLLDRDGHIWAIDHGLCFHVDPKLRTVCWDFAGLPVPRALLADLVPLSRGKVPPALHKLLSSEEIGALAARTGDVCAHGRYPEPKTDYPYPWPLL